MRKEDFFQCEKAGDQYCNMCPKTIVLQNEKLFHQYIVHVFDILLHMNERWLSRN